MVGMNMAPYECVSPAMEHKAALFALPFPELTFKEGSVREVGFGH
jgi:hypothetical protein